MSRSFKHTNKGSITNRTSEKYDKTKFHRRYRHLNNNKLKKESEDFEVIDENEVDDIWNWQKDGKMYFDKDKFPKLMRK